MKTCVCLAPPTLSCDSSDGKDDGSFSTLFLTSQTQAWHLVSTAHRAMLRYHFTLTGKAKGNKTENSNGWGGCEVGTFLCCCWVYNMVQLLWKSLAVPQNELPYDLESPLLVHVTTGMNLENVMVSEGSQTQKATYCMVSFIRNVHNRQIHSNKTD